MGQALIHLATLLASHSGTVVILFAKQPLNIGLLNLGLGK
jgi:hypothetical protein